MTSPGGAVDRDRVALGDLPSAEAARACRSRSITSSSTPATHGLPMPRATTAACEVMPPNAVTIPAAWMSPWMSAAAVSERTRITLSPALAARLGGVCIEHDDAAGRARGGVQPRRGDVQLHARIEHRMQQLVELGRVDAPDRLLAVDQPSPTIATAVLTAAAAVRLAERVCSRYRRPSSIVNSMSWTSR